ncbi:MAG: hypothetical protein MJE77_14670 [Proteobacteria bacterium]|nr:hypothetical protein [Pseudomonadota bacterium]
MVVAAISLLTSVGARPAADGGTVPSADHGTAADRNVVSAGRDAREAGHPGQGSPWNPALPKTWRELPRVAASAERAARQVGGRALQFRSRSWGDPADGCFLVVAEVTVSDGTAASVLAELARAVAGAGFEVSEHKTSSEYETDGENTRVDSRLAFAGHDVRGQMYTVAFASSSDRLRVRSAACFYSQREPQSSARTCQTVLQRLGEYL